MSSYAKEQNPLLGKGIKCEEPETLPLSIAPSYCSIEPTKEIYGPYHKEMLEMFKSGCLDRKNEFTNPFIIYFDNPSSTLQAFLIREFDEVKIITPKGFQSFADDEFVYWKVDFKNCSDCSKQFRENQITFGNTMRLSRFDLTLERNTDTSGFNFQKAERKRIEALFQPTLHTCEIVKTRKELGNWIESTKQKYIEKMAAPDTSNRNLSDRKF